MRARLLSTFKAFTYRDYRLLWGGAFTSSVGTWMQQVAQNWLILTISGSAFLLGFAAFLADMPFLLFSLFGGVLADRVDRRRILLLSQVVQLSSAFLLTALVATSTVKVWMILCLSVGALGGVAWFYARSWRTATRAATVALALVLIGAAGNLADRVFLGYVRDFIDFVPHLPLIGHWAIFNVADACLTMGVLLLLCIELFSRPADHPATQ